jgi:hypothetical protein
MRVWNQHDPLGKEGREKPAVGVLISSRKGAKEGPLPPRSRHSLGRGLGAQHIQRNKREEQGALVLHNLRPCECECVEVSAACTCACKNGAAIKGKNHESKVRGGGGGMNGGTGWWLCVFEGSGGRGEKETGILPLRSPCPRQSVL